MTNFIHDNTGLYTDKIDIVAPAGALVNYVAANDLNLLLYALKDIQAWLRGTGGGGTFTGMTESATDPVPSGVTNYLWLKTDGTLWLTIGGVAKQVGGGSVPGSQLYGAGFDGALTFNGTSAVLGYTPVAGIYTIDRFLSATSITGSAGVEIATNGYGILCQGAITGPSTGSPFVISSRCATPTGRIGTNAAITSGNFYSTTPQGSSGANGGGAGNNGSPTTNGLYFWPSTTSTAAGASATTFGCAGGGGTVTTNTGGTGGGCTPVSKTTGTLTSNSSLYGAVDSNTSIKYTGGASGGGGGAAGSGVGGAGGGGGGWLYVCAKQLTGFVLLSAQGGNGGPGTNTFGGSDPSAGGGGGGGGVVNLYYGTKGVNVTTSVAGGTGGVGSFGAASGGNGFVGTIAAVNLSGDGT